MFRPPRDTAQKNGHRDPEHGGSRPEQEEGGGHEVRLDRAAVVLAPEKEGMAAAVENVRGHQRDDGLIRVPRNARRGDQENAQGGREGRQKSEWEDFGTPRFQALNSNPGPRRRGTLLEVAGHVDHEIRCVRESDREIHRDTVVRGGIAGG
jgi:hypothetical protein